MRRLFSMVLTLCTVLSVMSVFAVGVSAESGTAGGCRWTLEGGVLTISGSGEVDFGYEPSWRNRVTEIVINEGPTVIYAGSFYGFANVKKVTLPNTITRIGVSAFARCASLVSINIPDSVTNIEASAFQSCNSLVSIKISAGVTKIGVSALMNSDSLAYIDVDPKNPKFMSDDGVLYTKDKTVIIKYPPDKKDLSKYVVPDTVKVIEGNAFAYAHYLNDVDVPDTVEKIGLGAFFGTSIYDDVNRIVDGILYVDDHAIVAKDEKMSKCIVKEGTKTIADCCFIAHKNLKNVILPEGLKSICHSAFSGCRSLESVFIPDTVDFVGDGAFLDCPSLKTIYYRSDKRAASIIDVEGDNDSFLGATWLYNCCKEKDNHVWSQTVKVSDPTCTEEGTEERRCTICNEPWVKTFAPLGHSFGDLEIEEATCVRDGIKSRTCSTCFCVEENIFSEAFGHSYSELKLIKKATVTREGEEIMICSYCSDTVIKNIPRVLWYETPLGGVIAGMFFAFIACIFVVLLIVLIGGIKNRKKIART